MKKLLLTVLTFCSILAFNLNANAAPPAELWQVKNELIKYHDNGRYNQDIAEVISQAKNYLKDRIVENKRLIHPKPLAIVLDIDETALSNYNEMLQLDFGGNHDIIDHGLEKANDPAIKPTLALYNFALKHGVKVYFVTGRKEHLRQATIKNLHNAGYKNWSGLILKPEDYHEKSAIPFKATARQVIQKMGYDIVLTMGDQYSDIDGGYADKGFKLPNPYYYIA